MSPWQADDVQHQYHYQPITRPPSSTLSTSSFTSSAKLTEYTETELLTPALCDNDGYQSAQPISSTRVSADDLGTLSAHRDLGTQGSETNWIAPASMGKLASLAALDMEPFPLALPFLYKPPQSQSQGQKGYHQAQTKETARATFAIFGANILWTITYDTIYAHQDVADDAKAGVKGMALRFRHSTKLLAGMLSACQVGLLALCGLWAGFGTFYFLGTVGGVGVALAYYIYDVDLESPESWLIGEYLTNKETL
ncbi:hypothetical protein O1611_g2914 [Lasiodiplodia mahajangana]|uniref:Uncharacterized protein n=1 Tax=Lasiodiplodia mahajangana TaxID=1108764 RepID=A0ACC2JT79_9PEZI|nr:hypothetical protein O1611_g2914 [Lasiodiplodia mahajangana]